MSTELSTIAREVFNAIQRAAVVGAALDGLLALEELRETTPHAGPGIDSELRNLLPRLSEMAARGDGKGVAAELAALRLRVQSGSVLPRPYTPTPSPKESVFPPPRPERVPAGIGGGAYPHLDSFGMPRAPVKPE